MRTWSNITFEPFEYVSRSCLRLRPTHWSDVFGLTCGRLQVSAAQGRMLLGLIPASSRLVDASHDEDLRADYQALTSQSLEIKSKALPKAYRLC